MQLCYRLSSPNNIHLLQRIYLNANFLIQNNHHLHLSTIRSNVVLAENQRCKVYQQQYKNLVPIQKNLRGVNFSTKSPTKVAESNIAEINTFRPIFRFAYIPIIVSICRLKVYMTAGVCGFSPVILYNAIYQNLDPQIWYNFGILLGFSVGTLGFFGEFFRRCVCIVYINKDDSTVKLSHMSFWGKRKDVEIPLNDIVPLSETSERVGWIFWKIRFYENSIASKAVDRSALIICTRFGNVIEDDALVKIFGNEIISNK